MRGLALVCELGLVLDCVRFSRGWCAQGHATRIQWGLSAPPPLPPIRTGHGTTSCRIGMSHVTECTCCSSVAIARPNEHTFCHRDVPPPPHVSLPRPLAPRQQFRGLILGRCGLHNLGNTCFVNSVVQVRQASHCDHPCVLPLCTRCSWPTTARSLRPGCNQMRPAPVRTPCSIGMSHLAECTCCSGAP
jgi:hypothetical protein